MLIFLAVAVVLLAVLLFLRAKFTVKATFENGQFYAFILVKVLFFHYFVLRIKLEKEDSYILVFNKPISKGRAIKRFNIFKRKIINTAKALLQLFKLKYFNLDISAGLEDADKTAILCGSIYSLFGPVVASLLNIKKKASISVKPVFDKTFFELHFECIFYGKLVHIIYEIVKLRRELRDGKTSYRKHNVFHHGKSKVND